MVGNLDFSHPYTGVTFYFIFLFLENKNARRVKSRVPVAKSVNDMHNGVLTREIIELDRTQLPAKATFLLSDLRKLQPG